MKIMLNQCTIKNRKVAQTFKLQTLLTAHCSLFTALLLVLFSLFSLITCSDLIDYGSSNPHLPPVQTQPGIGYFIITYDDSNARTIYPDTPVKNDFARYRLVFTNTSNSTLSFTVNDYDEEYNFGVIPLQEGSWTLVVYAYKNKADEDTAYTMESNSSLSFTVTEGVVTPYPFSAINLVPNDTTGTGTLRWIIDWPDASNITSAKLTVTSLVNNTQITGSPFNVTKNTEGSVASINNGFYSVIAALTDNSGRTAETTEVVKIMRNLTTTFEYEFTEDDFIKTLPPGSTVTISPSAAADLWVNQTLTATPSDALIGAGGTIKYIWRSGTTVREVSESSTYEIQLDDIYSSISVTAYLEDRNGTTTASSTAQVPDLIGIYNKNDQLAKIGMDYPLDGNYFLVENIDVSGTPSLNNWTPIGNNTNRFTGIFDGNGKTITGLIIISSSSYQGLFGYISGGTVKNVGLVGASVTGGGYTGGIVGNNSGGTISGCFFSGTVTGSSSQVGGIAGYSNGVISNCYNIGNVTSSETNVGGIVGRTATPGTVANCYNTGNVTAKGSIGGIVGYGNTVINCVSLGLFMTSGSGGSLPLRIRGADDDGTLSNNYAREDMMRNGNLAPSGTHNNASGENITLDQCNSETWWKTASNWSTTSPATVWNFDNVWEWGSKNLPILRGFAAGTQNHELPSHSSKTLTVTCDPSAGGTVNINAGGLSVSSGAQVVNDALVVLTATANTGYTFKDWTIDSAPAGFTLSPNNTASTATFSMPDNDVSITANFTATPVTVTPAPGGTTNFDTLQAALNAITTAGTGTYTVTLYANQSLAGSATGYSVPAGVKITLAGNGSERTITLTSAGRMFTVSGTGAELILGNNISLQGRGSGNSNQDALVYVSNGAFIMNAGSKITSQYYNASASPYGAAVYVTGSGSTFTMNGGDITGNQSGGWGAVVYAANSGSIQLKGGNITGNTSYSDNSRADVKANNASITLSGNATVNYICLHSDNNGTSQGNLYIASGWTGNTSSKITLVLHTNTSSLNTLITPWIGKQVLQAEGGGNPSTANIAKFTPGWFYGNLGLFENIGDYAAINATIGVLNARATGVTLNKSSTNIYRGAAETLTATVTPAGVGQTVTWTSSNTAVATVSASGVITPAASGSGTTTITATTLCGTRTTTCAVFVPDVTVTGFITNQTELAAIQNDTPGYWVVANDFTVDNTYTISGPFSGTLDGNGHTITMNINTTLLESPTTPCLMLHIKSEAIVKNLILKGSITGNYTVSNPTLIFLGIVHSNEGTILNISSSVTITLTATNTNNNAVYAIAGGIAGENSGIIKNCYTTGNITGTRSGGIAGCLGGALGWGSYGTIMFCWASGNITGNVVGATPFAGGIAGIIELEAGNINNCVALNGSITTSGYIGRITTSSEADLSNNYSNVIGSWPSQSIAHNEINGANFTNPDLEANWKLSQPGAGPNWSSVWGGTSEDAPWKWSGGTNPRPILWFETEVNR